MSNTVKQLILDTINDPKNHLGTGTLYSAFRLRLGDQDYVLRVYKAWLERRYDPLTDAVVSCVPTEAFGKLLDELNLTSVDSVMEGVQTGQVLMSAGDKMSGFLPDVTINAMEPGRSLYTIQDEITHRLTQEGYDGAALEQRRDMEMVRLLASHKEGLEQLFASMLNLSLLAPRSVAGDCNWGNILLDETRGQFRLIDQVGPFRSEAPYSHETKLLAGEHVSSLKQSLLERAEALVAHVEGADKQLVTEYMASVKEMAAQTFEELEDRDAHPRGVALRKVARVDVAPASTPPHVLLEQLRQLEHAREQTAEAEPMLG